MNSQIAYGFVRLQTFYFEINQKTGLSIFANTSFEFELLIINDNPLIMYSFECLFSWNCYHPYRYVCIPLKLKGQHHLNFK